MKAFSSSRLLSLLERSPFVQKLRASFLTDTLTNQVNGKDYPFKAGNIESAKQWVETLTALQSITKFRERRGSVESAQEEDDDASENGAAPFTPLPSGAGPFNPTPSS